MNANASKLFHSPVPGVFTPRSSGWNINHRRNVFPPGTLDQTPALESADSRPGWYARLQLHVTSFHGLPHAAIPAGPTWPASWALGYANRLRHGPVATQPCQAASKVPPRLRGNASGRRELLIGDRLILHMIG